MHLGEFHILYDISKQPFLSAVIDIQFQSHMSYKESFEVLKQTFIPKLR